MVHSPEQVTWAHEVEDLIGMLFLPLETQLLQLWQRGEAFEWGAVLDVDGEVGHQQLDCVVVLAASMQVAEEHTCDEVLEFPAKLWSDFAADVVEALVESLYRVRRIMWQQCQRFEDAPYVPLAEEAGDVAAQPEAGVEVVLVLFVLIW